MLPGEGKEDRADALKETCGGSRGDLQGLRRTVALGALLWEPFLSQKISRLDASLNLLLNPTAPR